MTVSKKNKGSLDRNAIKKHIFLWVAVALISGLGIYAVFFSQASVGIIGSSNLIVDGGFENPFIEVPETYVTPLTDYVPFKWYAYKIKRVQDATAPNGQYSIISDTGSTGTEALQYVTGLRRDCYYVLSAMYKHVRGDQQHLHYSDQGRNAFGFVDLNTEYRPHVWTYSGTNKEWTLISTKPFKPFPDDDLGGTGTTMRVGMSNGAGFSRGEVQDSTGYWDDFKLKLDRCD